MIKAKSVHSPINRRHDGLRVLATRIRGRGLKTTRYDVWMANLGPSQKLLRDGRSGRIGWAEFTKRYRAELFESASIDKKNPLIKNHGQKFTLRLLQELARRGPVTVMCHCDPDQKRCHRHILKRILQAKI